MKVFQLSLYDKNLCLLPFPQNIHSSWENWAQREQMG